MTEVCKVYEEHLDRILEAQANLPEDEVVLEVADFFDALGNPTRLKILLALMEAGELCTCDLSAITRLSVSAISHQLRILKDRKIVTYRKDGKNVFYRLDDEHIRDILRTALAHLSEVK
ncbi:helix-turn-helix transcriptional regulator [Thermococcus indicus]|uniref:Helix-turn-helix transcriptional regulator n=1 Tax=Thermococcus indicus TaxID=2586643 RepID=A0A4Y5SKE5_9EURY|nr:metalloregulator ArsR/SmtB family transcription factor [Thermococcus indicus]QDA31378.1 helix-turn-helix transcriptional regulator [Thermococcus indicus]